MAFYKPAGFTLVNGEWERTEPDPSAEFSQWNQAPIPLDKYPDPDILESD